MDGFFQSSKHACDVIAFETGEVKLNVEKIQRLIVFKSRQAGSRAHFWPLLVIILQNLRYKKTSSLP